MTKFSQDHNTHFSTSYGRSVDSGPYNERNILYDPNRFSNRQNPYNRRYGTRPQSKTTKQGNMFLGPQRNTVYDTEREREDCYEDCKKSNFTSLADQVEKTLGNCVPCQKDTAPAYGPPGEPNPYISYPVRAQFENRRKWNNDFGNPFMELKSSKSTKSQKMEESGGSTVPPHRHQGKGPYVRQPNPQDQPGGPRDDPIQPPPEHSPILLGCNITSSGDDQYAHRFTSLNRWFNEENGEILVGKPKGMDDKYVGSYSDELFKTPIDQTENKVSTGVMVNPYTGEMFETFENALPPPNTNKFIPQDRFKIVNPKLVAAQGGINPHAPLPKKKEVCLDIPGVEHGPNIWGDQLYADERRKRMREIANRDVWMNRDGDYAQPLGFAKEKPAGFVGLNPQYRAIPHLPATQVLDNKGYLPVTSQQFPEATSMKSEVFVRKPDLTTCSYQHGPGPINDVSSEYTVGQYTVRPTWRGQGDTYYTGSGYLPTHEAAEPQQLQNRPTLKEQMEQPFDPVNANTIPVTGGQSYVVQQYENRPTLKEQMEESFDPTNAYQTSGGQGYVIQQYGNRPTLKEQMEQQFSAQTVNPTSGPQSYVIQQYNNRPTLKEQMEQNFPSQTVNPTSGSQPYVIQQYDNRPTLKEQMEQEFPSQIATPNKPPEGHVVIDVQARPTLKEQMEEEFPLYAVAPDKPNEGHVVIDVEARPTLKEQMESTFDPFGWGNPLTGSWITFQGPLEETRRQFYENLPAVGRHGHFDEGVGGENVGPGLVTSKQHRGTFASDWVTLSKVPQDAEDTSVTWIGEHTRDTKRELGPYTAASDLSSYQQTMPRMFGSVQYPCNMDMREVDDEFLWSSGFQYPSQATIVG